MKATSRTTSKITTLFFIACNLENKASQLKHLPFVIRDNDCLLAAILPLLIGILALIKLALSFLFVVPRIMYEEEAKKSGQLAHMRGLLRSYRRRPSERYI